tara:strand:- start:2286 stop:3281 length:996 start_codon:yes stop_codon:yes gene_type:complete
MKNAEFHKQINYIANKLIKIKKDKPNAFCWDCEDSKNVVGTRNIIKSIILGMPKRRVKKLINAKCLSYISSYCSWRGNSFCTSGYSRGNKVANSVNKSYLMRVPKSKFITDKKDFIQIVMDVVGTACTEYPKFNKFVIKNGDGLPQYFAVRTRYRYDGIQKDYAKIILNSKDRRVLRAAVERIDVLKLSKVYGKYMSDDNIKIPSDIVYKITARLKTQRYNNLFINFVNGEKDSDGNDKSYSWYEQKLIVDDLSYMAEHIDPDKLLSLYHSLAGIYDDSLAYGSRSWIARGCMDMILSYMPRDKTLFALNQTDQMDNKIRWKLEAEETQWD